MTLPTRIALTLAWLVGVALTVSAQPHIVFMIADDLGWGDVSWRGGDARTPRLDQLRTGGMEFERYYAHPSCVPTRVALQTGRNPYRFGITSPGTGFPPLNEHFLPETLRAAGYATHLVGKWHLGLDTEDYYPTSRGFDHFFGFLGGGTDYFGTLNDGVRRNWLRDLEPVTDTGYSTDLFGDEAANIIAAHDLGQPLFLMVCFNAPHTPLEAPAELEANYPELTEDARTYAAMIESMDLAIGQIFDALAARGMINDTLIIFVSDNGAVNADTHGDNGDFRGSKGNALEGGVRLPGLAHWPGSVPAGTVSQQVIADVDWLPTLATVAETTPGTTAPLDGLDLSAALLDPGHDTPRTLLTVAQRTASYQTDLTKIYVDQQGDYTVYNLEVDPHEANDLSGLQPDLAAALITTFEAEQARMRADFSSNSTIGLANISVRASAGGTAGSPIPGFVLTGDGTKEMVLRAVGPTLADYGVTNAHPDPGLEVIRDATSIATNTQWDATDADAFASVGAFPLRNESTDAAIVTEFSNGAYTTPVASNADTTGVTLLEIYDADPTDRSLRVANTSTRAFVGTGDGILVPGFVVNGTGTARLLIRAVGPGLTEFGVTDALADPRLTLFRGSEAIATNTAWGEDPLVADAAMAAGAFALAEESADAALLVSLEAGLYTVAVEGTNGETGTALVELYLAPAPTRISERLNCSRYESKNNARPIGCCPALKDHLMWSIPDAGIAMGPF